MAHSIKLLAAIVTVFLFNSANVLAAGTVTGKVAFKGTAPKEELVKMNADPVCVKENAGKKVTKGDVVVNANGTLANVFVYVKEGVKNAPAPATTPVTFDQHGCMYTPRVFGVRTNQPIKIVNSDPTLHNVHSLPKANTGFNMGMATKGQTIEKKFGKPEMAIRIKCDVHGWMTATAHVLEHPYFAVTDTTGSFSIADLPPGEYTVEAWHEKLGTTTQKLTVKDGAQTLDFTFPAAGTKS